MKVFLTGATGFIGQEIVKQGLERGWEITALVRNPESVRARRIAMLGVRLHQGDVLDPASMRSAMASAELVIHDAGIYEYQLDRKSRERMMQVNVQGTENVLSLALELGVPKTMHMSTILAIGETGPGPVDETYSRQHPHTTWYEKSKTDAHRVAAEYRDRGLPLVTVCPGGVVGFNDHSPWGYFLRLFLNGLAPPLCWEPDKILSLVGVDDLASGIVLAAERGRTGETYLFAGNACSKREHFQSWEEAAGKPIIRFWLPAALFRVLFTLTEPLFRLLGLPVFLSVETVRTTSIHLSFSSAKAERELGWQYKPLRAMWKSIVEQEMAQLPKRRGQGWAARLRPFV